MLLLGTYPEKALDLASGQIGGTAILVGELAVVL